MQRHLHVHQHGEIPDYNRKIFSSCHLRRILNRQTKTAKSLSDSIKAASTVEILNQFRDNFRKAKLL